MAVSSNFSPFIRSINQALLSGAPSNTKHFLLINEEGEGVSLRDLPRSFSEAALDLNRRTWQVFRENLIARIGNRKFEWICNRYPSQLNINSLEPSGAPLLPEHVELFSIGSRLLCRRDLEDKFPGTFGNLTREQLSNQIWNTLLPTWESSTDSATTCCCSRSFWARLFYDQVFMDKEKQFVFDGDIAFSAWLERFSRRTANCELLEGQIIPAPAQDARPDYYEVYRKIATGDGLIAYALKPATGDSTLKPLIVFRSTQFGLSGEDAIETWLNDAQLNIGEMGWKSSIASFEELMNDPHFRPLNMKIIISGYSLGGVYAQYFLAAYYEKILEAILSAAPSVDEATALLAADNISQMSDDVGPLNIQVNRVRGDVVHYGGSKHVGWGVIHPNVNIQLVETDHNNRNAQKWQLHDYRMYDNPDFPALDRIEDLQKIWDQLDNSKRGPDVLWWEGTRRLLSGINFYAIKALAMVIRFVSWIFCIKILRSSRDNGLPHRGEGT